MANWDSSRVVIKITSFIKIAESAVAVPDLDVPLSMYNNFRSSDNQPFEKLHGAGPREFNKGVVRKIPSFSFSITCYGNTGVRATDDQGKEITSEDTATARLLRALQVSRKKFKLFTIERKEISTYITNNASYQVLGDVYSNCYVSSSDVSYDVAMVPMITFSCIAYRKASDYVNVDGNITSWTTSLFGDGRVEVGLDDSASLEALWEEGADETLRWTDI